MNRVAMTRDTWLAGAAIVAVGLVYLLCPVLM
jgi:hypothetical protein